MTTELEPGDYVTPSVRLLSPLAAGGMGTVWIAEHLVLETKVVVKLMTSAVAGSEEGAARFAREAAIAAAVKSPHVVQVFDSGVTDTGVAYIVMELLEGHDLGADLTARGRMAPLEVATIITQLSKALAKAHRVGVVHRDLKPENIFMCEVEGGESFMKLLDFGTAKDEQRAPFTTTAGQLLGTPYYMSPEQILGEEVDARTDIWSMGVLAFEALTGVRPFEGVTVGAITLAIHTTRPLLTDVVPELPKALDAWFDRACARAPGERFQTAKAAGDAFVSAVTGESMLEDSSPDPFVDSSPGALPPERGLAPVAARPPRTTAPSERIATSLSSTLSTPRHQRRTMTWIAAGVVTATVLGMLAFFAHDEPTPVAPASSMSLPTASAAGPAPSPVAVASSVTPPPAASGVAAPAVLPTSLATTHATGAAAVVSAGPAPSPFPRLPPGLAPAAAAPVAPSLAASASPGASPSPSPSPASSPSPSPAAAPAAAPSVPAPAATALPLPADPAPAVPAEPAAPDPAPTGSIDLGDLFHERT